MMNNKYYLSYIPLEDYEILLNIFNNGNYNNDLIEVPNDALYDLDTFISLNIDYKEGIVFLCKLPESYNDMFVNKQYFEKAKRLSTGTWFSNPESIIYENNIAEIENKEQLNRWIYFNKKKFIQYAYLKWKLCNFIKKDYEIELGKLLCKK